MAPRKLFVPSPVKKLDSENDGSETVPPRRSTRSATLRQGTLTGYSLAKRRKIDDATRVEVTAEEDKPSKRSGLSATPACQKDVSPSLPSPSTAALSPPPPSPPPSKPTDFLQVTSPSFLSTTSTEIPGVHYLPSFLDRKTACEWYDSLVSLPQWYRPTLKLYGREIVQSRQIIAFSKVPNLKLKYSGTQVEMHEWPTVLREMEQKCREVIGEEVRFNHAMLNYYPDGETYIGRHSDNLENKVILTVSLGSPRTWIMTKKHPHGAKAAAKKEGKRLPKTESHKWTLHTGSLLLMQGETQKEWYHEIPKQAKVTEGRISITFRQLVYG